MKMNTSTSNRERQHLSIFKIWLLAIRPKTLPAACAPIIVAAGLAWRDGVFRFGPVLAALLAALLLQIGSNLANDVFDYKKGTDTEERVGFLRVTQAGLLTPKQVLAGMWTVFVLAAVLGVYLIYAGGWPILVVGVAAIVAAIAYTGGPYPLGYHGLGDVFVFIFFGPVALLGTYYVQAKAVSAAAVWASIAVGLAVVAILVVNNLRDIETDRKTGKRTLAVRFGAQFTKLEYFSVFAGAYLIPLVMVLLDLGSPFLLLTWLSVVFFIPLVKEVFHVRGSGLNKTLAGTARLVLIYSLLFAVGYLLG